MIRTIKTLAASAFAALALLAAVPAQAQTYTGVVEWIAADPSAFPLYTIKFGLVGKTSLCTAGSYAFINDNDWTLAIVADMRGKLAASKFSGNTITINTQFSSGGICHVSYMQLNPS